MQIIDYFLVDPDLSVRHGAKPYNFRSIFCPVFALFFFSLAVSSAASAHHGPAVAVLQIPGAPAEPMILPVDHVQNDPRRVDAVHQPGVRSTLERQADLLHAPSEPPRVPPVHGGVRELQVDPSIEPGRARQSQRLHLSRQRDAEVRVAPGAYRERHVVPLAAIAIEVQRDAVSLEPGMKPLDGNGERCAVRHLLLAYARQGGAEPSEHGIYFGFAVLLKFRHDRGRPSRRYEDARKLDDFRPGTHGPLVVAGPLEVQHDEVFVLLRRPIQTALSFASQVRAGGGSERTVVGCGFTRGGCHCLLVRLPLRCGSRGRRAGASFRAPDAARWTRDRRADACGAVTLD
mmetsp:Transcript_14001/g.33944  ORF Transcript_14001/g.33944 Transcript_14001/m.33944 type:complete len:345 (+) Transcript_14001:1068-2102(+)